MRRPNERSESFQQSTAVTVGENRWNRTQIFENESLFEVDIDQVIKLLIIFWLLYKFPYR